MANTSIGNQKYPLTDAHVKGKAISDCDDSKLAMEKERSHAKDDTTAERAPGNGRMVEGTTNGQSDPMDPDENGDAYNPAAN